MERNRNMVTLSNNRDDKGKYVSLPCTLTKKNESVLSGRTGSQPSFTPAPTVAKFTAAPERIRCCLGISKITLCFYSEAVVDKGSYYQNKWIYPELCGEVTLVDVSACDKWL